MIQNAQNPVWVIIEDLAPNATYNPNLGLLMRVKATTVQFDLVPEAQNRFNLNLMVEHYYSADTEKKTISNDIIQPYTTTISVVSDEGRAYVNIADGIPFIPSEDTITIEQMEADTENTYMKEWMFFVNLYNTGQVNIRGLLESIIRRQHAAGKI